MKHLWMIIATTIAMLLALAACQPQPTPTLTAMPTAGAAIETPEPGPTATPTQSPTAVPTATPTAESLLTPAPNQLERLIFSAAECVGECEPAEGDVADMYMINSDGSGLHRLVEGLVKTGGAISVSPDGHYLAFVDARQDLDFAVRGPSHIYVLDITSQQVWSLMADRPDESSTGEPQWFPDSTRLAYVGGTADDLGNVSQKDIYIINLDGTERLRVTDRPPRSAIESLAVSPDGSRIAFAGRLFDSGPGEVTVYCAEVAGDGLYELAAFRTPLLYADVQWSPHGDRILIVVPPEVRGGPSRLLLSNSNGSAAQEFAQVPGYIEDTRWSSDGEFVDVLAYHLDGSLTGYRIDLDGNESQELFRIEIGLSPGEYREYRWSPNGGQVAFSRIFSVRGNTEQRGVYVVDVSSGAWWQLLSGYNVWDIAWLSDTP